MKKIVYTIAFLLAALTAAKAQTPIKETREEIADVVLFKDNLLIYTKKEAGGQYLYTQQKGADGTAQKDAQLNAGVVNTIVGRNNENTEVYVYQKLGRKKELISFYTYTNGSFTKTGERKLPGLMNNSYNLGLFLTPDKQALYISAELGKTYGYDDIYISRWKDTRWSKPKNFGKAVNTRQAEFAPFVANDSLFFARKKDQESYIYGVPLQPTKDGVTSAPVRLDRVNKDNSFNAYYKKLDNKNEVWITRATASIAGDATTVIPTVAYISGDNPPVTETKPEVATVKPAPAEPAKVKPAREASFNYGFNEVFLADAEVEKLIAFLEQHETGASLVVVGYSDTTGPENGKRNVSRQRAAFVKWLIEQKLTNKQFQIQTQQQVLNTKGEGGFRAEIVVK